MRGTDQFTALDNHQQDMPSVIITDSDENKALYDDLLSDGLAHSLRRNPTTSYAEMVSAPSNNPLTSTLCRDILLSYAQRDYLTLAKPFSNRFAPVPMLQPNVGPPLTRVGNLHALLALLRTCHPTHLPTLLLLGSVYFTSGDFQSSLEINQEILRLEPCYVEAICNIGCIFHALNKPEIAYTWWWQALKLQPMYWEVVDNLLDLASATEPHGQVPQRAESLAICDFVRSRLLDESGNPQRQVPPEHLHRLQSITFTRASILQNSLGSNAGETPINYSHVINLALIAPQSPFDNTEQFTLGDLMIATCITGLFLTDQSVIPSKILVLLGLEDRVHSPEFSILHVVHRLGNELIVALHEVGFNVLPMILLNPDQVKQLPLYLFTSFHGNLPSNCSVDSSGNSALLPESIRNITNQISSQAVMMIAKHFQDLLAGASVVDGTFQSCRLSASLVALLYYISLAIYPTAIGYNNLGALISTNVAALSIANRPMTIDAESITIAFYEQGLKLAPDHAHLLTNLASVLREKGKISSAISLYLKAIETDPNLDAALINLGNVLRDVGRPWDSVQFFKRVSELKSMPDAICGLAGALTAICDWRGRGWLKAELDIVQTLHIKFSFGQVESGWIHDLVATCEAQLRQAYTQNLGLVQMTRSLQDWLGEVKSVHHDQPFSAEDAERWEWRIGMFYADFDRSQACSNEGGFLIRLVEWLTRGLQRKWYIEEYGPHVFRSSDRNTPQILERHRKYQRPLVPRIGHFSVPALQPFHTFSFPLDARTIRLISHRNALRVSYRTLTQSWLPDHVYPPPPPPRDGRLNIGYVSHDFADHPLSHLVQSIFEFHDASKFKVHAYATSADDGSSYRRKISHDSHIFVDVSTWPLQAIVNRIVADQIHILINLGGFTRGANNDIFAARPCPVQILAMGFPGTCSAGWCDYLLTDVVACPPKMQSDPLTTRTRHDLRIGAQVDPEAFGDWMFIEKMIYMPHTFMVTDHLQTYRRTPQPSFDEEQRERSQKRRDIFPDLDPNTFIFANFNQVTPMPLFFRNPSYLVTFLQLYKIDPVIFLIWLSILRQVPRSILWLLRFPTAGEENIKRTARSWADDAVASRIRFTDVASKDEHIRRAMVVDLFLDTAECSAHTVATDVLWSGTPVLTWPKHLHKMCSRVAASIVNATGFRDQMVVQTAREYEERAVALALQAQATNGSTNDQESGLISLRRGLHRDRYTMPLFDTRLWTRNFEKACWEAWERWVTGVDLLESGADDRSSISFTEECDTQKGSI